MARSPAQNAAIYAARQARAKAAGFKSYAEQRKYRTQAAELVPGNSKKDVAARDAIAKEIKDYETGDLNIDELRNKYGQLLDDYDIDIDFNGDDWYDFLDELSPKGGK